MAAIVAITNGSPHSWIIINAITERFGPITVLTEDKERRSVQIRRRIKRQGLLTVAGQIGFLLLSRLLAKGSRDRIKEIVEEHRLNPEPCPVCELLPIGSVNSPACRDALARLQPEVVVVFGTRIIGKETLSAIRVPVMNFHSGITPKYRGQAGGYWALANGDPDHAGVTVHLVDAGVDTGEVLYQARFEPGRRDNFATYFYLQAAAFRPIAVRAVEDALRGDLKPFRPSLPSALWHHPTLWTYLTRGLQVGIW